MGTMQDARLQLWERQQGQFGTGNHNTVFSMEATGDFPDFKVLCAAFPALSARILGYIGKKAAQQLYEEHLQGQDITYHNVRTSSTGMPRSKTGRRLVGYAVGRGLKWVSVASYPLNLFESGQLGKVNNAGYQRYKGILRGKLASGLSGRLGNYIAEIEKFVVDDWFNDKSKERIGGAGALREL